MILEFTYFEIAWYFLIYSFLGWCTEVVYCTIKEKRIINRGFLNGPYCPIYGFGLVGILFLAKMCGYNDVTQMNIVTLFIASLILSTLIELVGGWALFKLFHTRWWDYSMRKGNFHGYICPLFSFLWGIGGTFVIKVVHSIIEHMVLYGILSLSIWIPILVIVYLLFILDVILTAMTVAGMNKKLAQIDEISSKMRTVSNDLSDQLGSKALEADDKVNEKKERLEEQIEVLDERKEEFEQYLHSFLTPKRLIKAYPNMKHLDYDEALHYIKEMIERK